MLMAQKKDQNQGVTEIPHSALNSLELAGNGLHALTDALTNRLGADFLQALEMIEKCSGRLIVVGVGKSGHIGAKLASTFASTGTPSFFVHPTEASHGDLGMISKSDTVLMISWSGETRELLDITAYCKRFSIPMIALTGDGESLLASAADVVLQLPFTRESCPHNLAPTTSTLMQLALGDALAVSLVERRGFSKSNFYEFHPGGQLGASLVPVRDLMKTGKSVPLITHSAAIMDGLALLTEKSVGIIGVIDDFGTLIGVITDGDVRRYLSDSAFSTMKKILWETPVAEIMSKNPVSIPENTMAVEGLAILRENKISALFVVKDEKPVGILTLLTLLQAGVA